MKKLMMATDLSARSDRAFRRAVHLARDHDAELTVVHVVDEDVPSPLAEAHETAAKQTIRESIELLNAAGGPHISVQVVFGRAYVEILEVARQTAAEIIILGMHREDSFKDMFRGTTAERIIRGSHIPVLLVKDQAAGPYQRVVVGVDFSVYSRRAIEFSAKFVPSAHLYLVHAYDVPFKGFLYGRETRKEVAGQHEAQFRKMIEEEMAAFFSRLEVKAPKIERIMQPGLVDDVIRRQVDRLGPDLLVVGTHGRPGASHAFLGSVAEDLLRSPPCDVLAVTAW